MESSPCHLALGLKDLLIVNNDGATRCSSAEARRPAFHTLTSARSWGITMVRDRVVVRVIGELVNL